ncbi:MAG: DUF559 domain-containing protein [Anaerolineales bacterium]|nr:DUF559 domain-containing protein [Anaerolineales bacterium]
MGWQSSLTDQNKRTVFLHSKGYKVLHFWNNDVMNNLENVLTVLWDALKE